MLSDSVAYFARARPDALACYDFRSQARLSYAALHARVDATAAMLERRLGPENVRGARVATLARNGTELVCLHIACRRLGAIFVPLNWRLSARELALLASLAEPALLIYESEFASALQDVTAAAPAVQTLALDPTSDYQRELDASPPRPASGHATGDDDAITILFTSGTTGRPKGVVITERNARASGFNYALSVNLHADSVALCDMPMFHVVGLLAVTCATLQVGGALLISPQFNAELTYARLTDPALGVTNYFCVPQMLRMMRDVQGFDAGALRKLAAIQTGGAPHPASAIRQWVAEGVRVVDGYGMTEVGTALGMPPGDLALIERKAGSIGVPAPLIEARLVDRDGHDVAEDGIGEIWLRGESLTPGYWRDENAGRAALQDGWIRTGDAAKRDADGFFTIVDRWKDMYISGGENVYPVEIEAVMLELQGVVEAAVIGVPDERWGEVGAVFLVCAAGATITDEAVIQHCRARLAGYKVPRHVRRVNTLPRTASGKLQKGELRSTWSA
jgi:fatty-acyl-CoA synthase